VEAAAAVRAADCAKGAAALGLVALLGTTLVTAPAFAQASEADVRAARQLFVDAEHDEDAGRWSDAYDKLQRVAAVKLTAGVRYHLALCQEKLGKLATALDGFHDAQKQAQADDARDVLRLVGKELEELEPRVPKLTIHVVPPVDDAVVRLDGTAIAKALVGVAIPLDPGSHTVEASAPNRAPAKATIAMGERDVTSIDLQLGEPHPPGAATGSAPAAAPATASGTAPESAPASAPAAESSSTSSHSIAAPLLTTIGAVALVGLGIGAYLAAGNAVTSGQQQCASQTFPCDSAITTVRAWDFTAAGAWIGAAALGTVAVVLWAHSSHAQPASAALSVGPARIELGGRF
jgi:biotin carboxyl carrier protein